MYCRKCGSELKSSAKFCENCGKKTEGRTGWILPVIIVSVISAAVFCLFYFDIITINKPSNDHTIALIATEPAPETPSMTPEKSSSPIPSPTPTATPQPIHIVNASHSDFIGEWVYIGKKESIEGDIEDYTGAKELFVSIANGYITDVSYNTESKEPIFPWMNRYLYRKSGGIDGLSYIEGEGAVHEYFIDSEGYMLSIDYLGNSTYDFISVYEKRPDGTIEEYLKSVGIDFDLGREYGFSPPDNDYYPLYSHLTHYVLTGYARNPYIDTDFNPDEMDWFAPNSDKMYLSYLKVDSTENLTLSSKKLGTVTFESMYTHMDAYETSCFVGYGYADGEKISVNIFRVLQNFYVSISPFSEDYLASSHFYVFSRYVPFNFRNLMDISVNPDDFQGVWITKGPFYDKDGKAHEFLKGDFMTLDIMPDNSMEYINNYYRSGNYTKVSTGYETTDLEYYLDASQMYNDESHVILTIDNEGRLCQIIYELGDEDYPYAYIQYAIYERFDSTMDEAVAWLENDDN